MNQNPSLFVIIPVFNEAGNMARLMVSLQEMNSRLEARLSLRFILVDDGSSDGTPEIARGNAQGISLEVISHPVNRGPGRAFATAFESIAVRLAPADWVLTIEGDNTSRLDLVEQMLTRANEGFGVVLASPYLYGGGIQNTSTYRVILSHIANVFVKETLGLHGIVTMSSFFRLYRGSVIQRLQACFGAQVVERSGFESMIEMLLKMVYLQVSISEIAMSLDTSRRAGRSKMRIARTAAGYITLWKDKQRWCRLARDVLAVDSR